MKTTIRLTMPLLLALAAPPLAAQEKPLGEFKGWQAYSFAESGRRSVWSGPNRKTQPVNTNGAARSGFSSPTEAGSGQNG